LDSAVGARRVDFVCLPIRDRERSTRFYEETLGLERNPNSSDAWVEYEVGNLTLALLPFEYMGREEFAANAGPVALRVNDVEESRRVLAERGVEFRMETIDSGVCHMAVFTDPDGNALMLHRRYAPFRDGSQPS
jgi:catechol 2,3-dioxygenase-like lactoylglutathione lyase family enzyme